MQIKEPILRCKNLPINKSRRDLKLFIATPTYKMATGRSPLSLPPLPSPLKLESSNGSSGSSGSSSEVAPFISKVWSIVNDESILHLVTWSEVLPTIR